MAVYSYKIHYVKIINHKGNPETVELIGDFYGENKDAIKLKDKSYHPVENMQLIPLHPSNKNI